MEMDHTTVKYLRNRFRLKEEIDDITIKDIGNLSRLKKVK